MLNLATFSAIVIKNQRAVMRHSYRQRCIDLRNQVLGISVDCLSVVLPYHIEYITLIPKNAKSSDNVTTIPPPGLCVGIPISSGAHKR